MSKVQMKLLLVEDNAFNQEGVRLFFEKIGFEIIGADNISDGWQLIQTEQPQVAIIDIVLPEHSQEEPELHKSLGTKLATQIKKQYPLIGVILFSAYEDRGQAIFDLINEGYRGIAYKLKGCKPQTLLDAIHAVQAGEVIIDAGVTNRPHLLEGFIKSLTVEEYEWVKRSAPLFQSLTNREKEVAKYIASSYTVEGIAERLFIQPKSVEGYIGRVYKKLGFDNLPEQSPHLRKSTLLAKVCLYDELGAYHEHRISEI